MSAPSTSNAPRPRRANPERYSARGPAPTYFDPVIGIVPAAKLATPDRTEAEHRRHRLRSNTFFGNLLLRRLALCRTLIGRRPTRPRPPLWMKQTAPLASPAGIVGAMEASGTPFTVVNTRAAVGGGLLNARAAIEALGGTPVDDPRHRSSVPRLPPPMPTRRRPPWKNHRRARRGGAKDTDHGARRRPNWSRRHVVRIASPSPEGREDRAKRSVRRVFRFAGDPQFRFPLRIRAWPSGSLAGPR